MKARIQNAISVAIWKNCSNVKIAFYLVAKTRFDQFKNFFDAPISSWTSHILNPWIKENHIQHNSYSRGIFQDTRQNLRVGLNKAIDENSPWSTHRFLKVLMCRVLTASYESQIKVYHIQFLKFLKNIQISKRWPHVLLAALPNVLEHSKHLRVHRVRPWFLSIRQ